MIEDEPCNQPDGDEQGEDQTSDQPPTRRTIRRRHVLNVGGLRRALFELGGHGTPRLRPRYLGCLNGADCTAPLHSSFSDATAPAVETSAMHVLLPDLVRGVSAEARAAGSSIGPTCDVRSGPGLGLAG